MEVQPSEWVPNVGYYVTGISYLSADPTRLSDSDYNFLQQLTMRTVNLYAPHIMALAQSKASEIPLNEMAISVDYTVSPPAVDIVSLERLTEYMIKPDAASC